MGYDLHITRADFWADSAETPITADEWKSYVDASEDLEWRPEATFLSDAEADVAVWTAHPEPELEAWLAYFEGEIFTKNPDEPLIRRMVKIAQALGAHVAGDDGERYGADGRVIPDENFDEEGRPRQRQSPRRGLLGRLFGGGT